MKPRPGGTNAEIVLRATMAEKTTVGVVFISWHFAGSAVNLLTNDALDPQAKIPA
jgi:predicted molibdopterin-dependent oxidoreductase YjgC